MAEYLIQGDTLSATADAIRKSLGVQKVDFTPEVGTGQINRGSITVYYTEYIDTESYGMQEGDDGFDFVVSLFLPNGEGKIVPVLLDDYDDTMANLYYYEGTDVIDGTTYDKWRRISNERDEYESPFTWDSENKCYKYTNIIVVDNNFCPTEFPQAISGIYETGYQAGYKAFPSERTATITIEPLSQATITGTIRYSTAQLGYVSRGLEGVSTSTRLMIVAAKNTIFQIESTTLNLSISGSYTTISDTNPYTWVIHGDCTITGS